MGRNSKLNGEEKIKFKTGNPKKKDWYLCIVKHNNGNIEWQKVYFDGINFCLWNKNTENVIRWAEIDIDKILNIKK